MEDFFRDDSKGWFGIMPATDDYVRKPKSMHQVFCASAVLLFFVTIWMMWADYNDEWRTFQRQAFIDQAQRTESKEKKIKDDPAFQRNVAELEQKVKQAEETKQHDEDLKVRRRSPSRQKQRRQLYGL